MGSSKIYIFVCLLELYNRSFPSDYNVCIRQTLPKFRYGGQLDIFWVLVPYSTFLLSDL